MTTATADKHADPAAPTEDAAIPGVASRFGVVVSEAERWIENGVHVIRSTEFDVIAGDPDFDRAVDLFIDNVEDLWIHLGSIEELTDNENEVFLALSPRFVAIHKELERREAERRSRLISISIGGWRRAQRGGGLGDWQPSSTAPEHSAQPSVA